MQKNVWSFGAPAPKPDYHMTLDFTILKPLSQFAFYNCDKTIQIIVDTPGMCVHNNFSKLL